MRRLDTQFIRFLLVGALNTAFGYGVFAALVLSNMDSGLALLCATLAGIIFNFFTTGGLVFRAAPGPVQFLRFFALYAVLYALNLACLKGLEALHLHPLAAQAILLPLFVIISYFLNKHVVFRPQGFRP